MNIATILVSGVHAHTRNSVIVPRGIVGATVTFDFQDPLWEGLSKTAVFQGAVTRDVIVKGNTAIIPAETVANEGRTLKVGVYGVDDKNNLAIPTLWATIGKIGSAADPSGDPGTEPDLPIWAQLADEVDRLKRTGSYGDVDINWLDLEDGEVFTSVGNQPDIPDEPDVPDIPDEPDEPDVPVVPEVTLTGLSATYTGGSVAVGTAVIALTGITVTAHYSDGSTAPVTGYMLAGTIAEGSNIITVSYGGKTTTFTVTGEAEEEQEQIGREGRAIIGDDGYIHVDIMTLNLQVDRTVASSGFATFQIDIPTNAGVDTTSEVLCKDKFTYIGTSYSGIRNGTSSPEVQYGYGYDGAGGPLMIRIPYSDYESVGATAEKAIAAIALHNRYIPFKLKDTYNTYSLTEEAIDAARYYSLPLLTDGVYKGWLHCSNGGTETSRHICNYGCFGGNSTAERYYCNNDPDPNQRLYVNVPEGAIEDATTMDGWKAFLKSRLPIEWYGV